MTYQIKLNGKQESIEDGITVAGLLEARGVKAGRVAVELNRRILRRDEFASTLLAAGDEVEVVTFVGGG